MATAEVKRQPFVLFINIFKAKVLSNTRGIFCFVKEGSTEENIGTPKKYNFYSPPPLPYINFIWFQVIIVETKQKGCHSNILLPLLKKNYNPENITWAVLLSPSFGKSSKLQLFSLNSHLYDSDRKSRS